MSFKHFQHDLEDLITVKDRRDVTIDCSGTQTLLLKFCRRSSLVTKKRVEWSARSAPPATDMDGYSDAVSSEKSKRMRQFLSQLRPVSEMTPLTGETSALSDGMHPPDVSHILPSSWGTSSSVQ